MLARIKADKAFGEREQIKEVRYDKLVINLTNYELRVTALDRYPPKELEPSTIWQAIEQGLYKRPAA